MLSNYKRNSWIYILENACNWAFFAIAVKQLFLRQYLDLTQIGLLTTAGIFAMLLINIPSGALADVWGRKKTIIFSRMLPILCYVIYTFGESFWPLLIGYVLFQLDQGIYSGVGDALLYDSFKENNQEDRYKSVRPLMLTVGTIIMAFASIIGGKLFLINPHLPYTANLMFAVICLLLVFFYDEPKMLNTGHTPLNIRSYLQKNIDGVKHIFSSPTLRLISLFCILMPVFSHSGTWYFHQQLALEFGYTITSISLLFFVLYILRAFPPLFVKKILTADKEYRSFVFVAVIQAIVFICALVKGPFLGSLMLGAKFMTDAFLWPTLSIVQNKEIDSQHRATALSAMSFFTYTLIVTAGIFYGPGMQVIGARGVMVILGIIALVVTVPLGVWTQKTMVTQQKPR